MAPVTLPGAELIVAASVLFAGALLAVERKIPAAWWSGLFVLAGLFHGYAFGESIDGAEAAPLAAYLIGLVSVQTALTIGVALASRTLWRASPIAPRLAGAAVCGVGFAALVAQIVPAP